MKGASPSLDVACPRCGAEPGFRCLDLRERRGAIRINGRVIERFARELGITCDEAQQRLAGARKVRP